jgi:hypothetical protein
MDWSLERGGQEASWEPDKAIIKAKYTSKLIQIHLHGIGEVNRLKIYYT